MKKGLLILSIAGVLGIAFLATIMLTAIRPAADKEAFIAADNLLAAGHTNEAIDVYEQLAAQGQKSSALYYNLGLAYYQQGNFPAAYAAFQQALALAPRDADIRHNLALAEAALEGTKPAGSLPPLTGIVPGLLSVNELALLALASWFLFGFLLLTLRVVKIGRGQLFMKSLLVMLLLLTVISGAVLVGQMLTAQPDISAYLTMAGLS